MTSEDWSGRFPFADPDSLRSAVLVCHRNADPDAYLSAYALSALLRRLAPACEVFIATPDGMTTLTSKLAERFPHPTVEEEGGDHDLYVAVDVGDTELLKGWRAKMQASEGVTVLIDHHPIRDVELYDHVIADAKATSSAEVVFRLFAEANIRPDRASAQALLLAMMFDSSHLSIAGEEGLRLAVKLMDAGADLTQARRDLRSEPDYGEVMAKLKGVQRLKVYRVGEWVVSTTTIGSFQAHVARALVFLGADVAVVGGESEEEARVSLRATQRFSERTGVELGTQVAEEVGKELGGHGGGHATAASLSAPTDENDAVERCLTRLSALLGAEAHAIA